LVFSYRLINVVSDTDNINVVSDACVKIVQHSKNI